MTAKDLMDAEVVQHLIDHYSNDAVVMEALKRWRNTIDLALGLEGELIEAELTHEADA